MSVGPNCVVEKVGIWLESSMVVPRYCVPPPCRVDVSTFNIHVPEDGSTRKKHAEASVQLVPSESVKSTRCGAAFGVVRLVSCTSTRRARKVVRKLGPLGHVFGGVTATNLNGIVRPLLNFELRSGDMYPQ